MIHGILVTVHVVICFFLVIIVLLQSGKAADLRSEDTRLNSSHIQKSRMPSSA